MDASATEPRAADLRDDVENFATSRRRDAIVKSGEEGNMVCFFGMVVGSSGVVLLFFQGVSRLRHDGVVALVFAPDGIIDVSAPCACHALPAYTSSTVCASRKNMVWEEMRVPSRMDSTRAPTSD
jgi:hypothetical protein